MTFLFIRKQIMGGERETDRSKKRNNVLEKGNMNQDEVRRVEGTILSIMFLAGKIL